MQLPRPCPLGPQDIVEIAGVRIREVSTTDQPPVDLFDYLECEEDERAVLSVIYRRADAELHLQYASLLVGPARMSEMSWAKWRLESTLRLGERLEPLADLPADLLIDNPATADGATLVAGRQSMSVPGARQWLEQLLENGFGPAIGALPRAQAQLGPPLHCYTSSQGCGLQPVA